MAARRKDDEPVRIRVAEGQLEAVRVSGIWLTPGGHEATVPFGDAKALLKDGVLVEAS